MRYQDLSPEQQQAVERYLQDACNEDVHEARASMSEAWDLEKKERHMKRAAKKDWEVLATLIARDLQAELALAVDAQLLRDLRSEHRDYWLDAAGWSDFD